MQAQIEHAGKRTKCPACGAVVKIPGDGYDEAYTNRPARSGVRGGDEEELPRPRFTRRMAKRRVWPWIAAAAALVLLVAGGVTAWLLWPAGAGASSADLALVPHDAVGFVSIRVADLWNSDFGKDAQKQLPMLGLSVGQLKEKFGVTPEEIERASFVVPTEEPRTAWFVVAFKGAVDQPKVVKSLFADAQETKADNKTYYISRKGQTAVHFSSPTIAVVGSPEAIQRFMAAKTAPAASGPMDEAIGLAQAGKHQIVGGFHLTPGLSQKLKALQGGMRGQARMFLPFLEVQSGTFTANLSDKTDTSLDLRLKFPDEPKAKKAKEAGDSALAFVKLAWPAIKAQMAGGPLPPQAREMFNQVDQTLQELKINQEGQVVHLPLRAKVALGAIGVGLLVPAVQKVREAAARTEMFNNIRQLGIALHDYNDSYKCLPPARFNVGLSWRVAILPFIEQAALYNQFHLNEPWDSPHNIKLLPLMPKVFAPPPSLRTPRPHCTFLKVFTGPGTPFDSRVKGMIPRSFPGGTSNAFLVVEAADAVEWTKPEDIAYDPKGPLAQLGAMTPGHFLAVLADASVVRFNRFKLTDPTLRQAIAPRADKVVGPDWQFARD
jgi:hypothetical protein